MKYSVVKQFSNGAVDNIFNFLFRWVDLGKILIDVFWAFISIWQAFFAIFYNLFMYLYYLVLFLIDHGSEGASIPRVFHHTASGRLSSAPALDISTKTEPVITSKLASAVSQTAETVKNIPSEMYEVITPARNPLAGDKGGKKNLLKTSAEALTGFWEKLIAALKKPFILISEFFRSKLKPVKEDDEENGKKHSLIDEYLKEYERQRR